MKHVKIILVALLAILLYVPAFAGTQGMKLTMPDGSIIPIDGLSDDEIKNVTYLMGKVSKSKIPEATEKVSQIATDMLINPEKLDAWRKTITGTIKDICNDLNVSVNDFIKTPVGNGVVIYLAYSMIGKDVLKVTAKVLFMVPFWIITMCILFYLQRKYLSVITYYSEKKEVIGESGKTEIIHSEPKREISYPWNTNDARTTFAAVLFGTGIVTTGLTIGVILF